MTSQDIPRNTPPQMPVFGEFPPQQSPPPHPQEIVAEDIPYIMSDVERAQAQRIEDLEDELEITKALLISQAEKHAEELAALRSQLHVEADKDIQVRLPPRA